MTPKPQTTHNHILKIINIENKQIIFINTPNIHHKKKTLNHHLTQITISTINNINIILFIIDTKKTTRHNMNQNNQHIIKTIKSTNYSTITLINKIDTITKNQILPLITKLSTHKIFSTIIPINTTQTNNLTIILKKTLTLLPKSPPLFPKNSLTNKSIHFLVTKLLHKQLFLSTKNELPYSITIEITHYKKKKNKKLIKIDTTIHIEHKSQKKIIINKNKTHIKKITTSTHIKIKKLIKKKIFLTTHIQIKPN